MTPMEAWWGKFWARARHCDSPRGVRRGSIVDGGVVGRLL